MTKKEKWAQDIVMNRNLEEHKQKTTHHARGDRVNVQQKGSTKNINMLKRQYLNTESTILPEREFKD